MTRITPALANGRLRLRSSIEAFSGDDRGATAIEYGLITSLIAIFMIAAVKAVGTSISAKFGSISANMT